MSSNYIRKIAMVGASGQSGSYMAQELLKANRFELTAITRADSTGKIPDGFKVAKVDYNSHDSLVSALTGQDALLITMAVTAPQDTQEKLIRAAADAGVPWILPNEYGGDYTMKGVPEDVMIGPWMLGTRALIKELGKSSYIAVACSFWYEYSLSFSPYAYGFDFKNKVATFYGDGTTMLNTTTWPQLGRAVAGILSLPIQREGSHIGACLNDYKNGIVRVASFRTNQREMLDSVLRVTGDKESDWTIKHEPAKERWEKGWSWFKSEGAQVAFAQFLYARFFFGDDSGDFEAREGLDNEKIGIKKGDQAEFDEFTKLAVGWAHERGQAGVQ